MMLTLEQFKASRLIENTTWLPHNLAFGVCKPRDFGPLDQEEYQTSEDSGVLPR